jgi:hypothetical protein
MEHVLLKIHVNVVLPEQETIVNSLLVLAFCRRIQQSAAIAMAHVLDQTIALAIQAIPLVRYVSSLGVGHLQIFAILLIHLLAMPSRTTLRLGECVMVQIHVRALGLKILMDFARNLVRSSLTYLFIM